MRGKINKLKRLLPKKYQTKRAGYLAGVLLILFSIFSYDIFFRSPKVKAATVGSSSNSAALGSSAQRHMVVTSNGTIVGFFDTGTQSTTGIAYSTSSDNGATWSSAVQVSSIDTADFSVAIDGRDNIYLAYSESGGGTGTGTSIYFKLLTYGGGTWTLGSAVTVALGSTGDCGIVQAFYDDYYNPTIAVNSAGTIEINLADYNYGYSNQACDTQSKSQMNMTSSNNGTTWTTGNGALQTTFNAVTCLPIVADGLAFWTVSSDGNLYIDKSGNGTWVEIPNAAVYNYGNSTASMSYSLDQLNFFYKNSSNNLVYRNYDIASATLSSETVISSNTNDTVGSISTDSQNLWAVYQSYVAANSYNVVYKRYNGSVWDTNPTSITTNNANNITANAPQRVPNTANVPVIWEAGTGSPFTISASTFSSIGSVTDTGNQTGAFTGTLTGSSGDVIVKCGKWYYNTVNIVSGMTVKVCSSNGQIGGSLTIYANSVTVAGTVDGNGRGLPGGISLKASGGTGGAGGNGVASATGLSGSPGSVGSSIAGSSGSGAFGGAGGSAGTNAATTGSAGVGGTQSSNAGGGFHGTGGGGTSTAGGSASIGGYLGTGVNGDTSIDEMAVFGSAGGAGGSGGSGAGGGGGGAGGGVACFPGGFGGSGGSGAPGGMGGKGGNAGAIIKIYAAGNVSVTGSVVATGQVAGNTGAATAGVPGGVGSSGTSFTIC